MVNCWEVGTLDKGMDLEGSSSSNATLKAAAKFRAFLLDVLEGQLAT